LIAWIVYNSFDDPETESAPFLFEKFTEIVEYKYSGDLAGFISKAGSTWSASALTDFFLPTNPSYQNMVTCGGNPEETYHGISAGFAVAEYDSVSLAECS